MSNYSIDMSKYDDGKSMFLSPKVTQYDNHMVMTNVSKPSKIKYVNIDTSFREDSSGYEPGSTASCSIVLPERITEVKSIKVRSVEIPISMYNISAATGNNCFQLVSGNSKANIVIPDGEYDIQSIESTIQLLINGIGFPFNSLSYSIDNPFTNKSSFYSTIINATINFAVTSNGTHDPYNFKKKLGWLLGFRTPTYILTPSSTIISEGVVNLNGSRYLYLVLDEFTRGNQNSFIAPLSSSLISKTILARVTLDNAHYFYGTVLTANNRNGLLLSDKREYTGRVDLQKLNIQLVDDAGTPISLNGLDYSFCLEVEHE
jgi:hypothetical protein